MPQFWIKPTILLLQIPKVVPSDPVFCAELFLASVTVIADVDYRFVRSTATLHTKPLFLCFDLLHSDVVLSTWPLLKEFLDGSFFKLFLKEVINKWLEL